MREDRVVATVGVENLVIVDTPDAVLVAHRDHLQRVREVVGELKARGHEAYKLHRTVARPWGALHRAAGGPGFKIKRIEVKPGGPAVAAAARASQRALGGRQRRGAGHQWRARRIPCRSTNRLSSR